MTAKALSDKVGKDNVILLFADTKIEDEDNYRFLYESAPSLGELVVVADGRTPFQVFEDRKFLGNSRIAPCSHILKQDVCRKWLKEYDPNSEATLYVGISWDEIHRLPAVVRNWAPWKVLAPLTEPPYLTKRDAMIMLAEIGIKPPRLYDYGLPHANCGGGCVKAGQAHWSHIYNTLPTVFAQWEQEEARLQEILGRDVTMMKRRKNGETTPFSLADMRREKESQEKNLDLFDWGGCGCFME